MGCEMQIPVGMTFRKMYCRYCGERLKVHKIVNVYHPGDPQFERVASFGIHGKMIHFTNQTKVTYVYKCPDCGKAVTYEEQVCFSKIQKKLGKKILSDDEI